MGRALSALRCEEQLRLRAVGREDRRIRRVRREAPTPVRGVAQHVEPGKPPRAKKVGKIQKPPKVNNRRGMGRCAKNGHLVQYSYGVSPIDGSEIG